MENKTSGTPSLHPGGSSPLRTGGRSFKGSIFTLVIHCTRARGGTLPGLREARGGTDRPDSFPHIQPAKVVSTFCSKGMSFMGVVQITNNNLAVGPISRLPPGSLRGYILKGARRVHPLEEFFGGSLNPRFPHGLLPATRSCSRPVGTRRRCEISDARNSGTS
jgi:hypothetical protein